MGGYMMMAWMMSRWKKTKSGSAKGDAQHLTHCVACDTGYPTNLGGLAPGRHPLA